MTAETLTNAFAWALTNKSMQEMVINEYVTYMDAPEIKPVKSIKTEITGLTFDDFWNLYDKKVGDKDKLRPKWDRLSEEDKRKALNYTPFYKEAQPNKQYRKNPETFLNNKCWNDELITEKVIPMVITQAQKRTVV
jgi:hypothetical protein